MIWMLLYLGVGICFSFWEASKPLNLSIDDPSRGFRIGAVIGMAVGLVIFGLLWPIKVVTLVRKNG